MAPDRQLFLCPARRAAKVTGEDAGAPEGDDTGMTPQKRPGQIAYERMIDRYIETDGAEATAIAAEIERAFAVCGTILVLDIAGFSRLTARRGVVFYLAMVRRMQVLAGQVMDRYDGSVIKFEADNLFALFDSVDHALAFALDMQNGFQAMNVLTEDDADIYASIGIATGDVLLIDGKDAWGHAMNVASKLGEDLAQGAEILVDADSFAAAEKGRYRVEPVRFATSGLEIPAVRLLGRVP